MDFEINIKGSDDLQEASELLAFFKEERFSEANFQLKRTEPQPGEMNGGEELAIIAGAVGAFISTPGFKLFVGRVLDIIQSYLHSNQKKSILIKNEEDKTMELNFHNIEDEEIVRQALELLAQKNIPPQNTEKSDSITAESSTEEEETQGLVLKSKRRKLGND